MEIFVGSQTLNKHILTDRWLGLEPNLCHNRKLMHRAFDFNQYLHIRCDAAKGSTSAFNSIKQSSIMTDEQPEFASSPEGIWMLDDTGKHLKFVSEEELNNGVEGTDSTAAQRTLEEATTEYLANLTPPQKIIEDQLRDLGWDENAITCSFFLKINSDITVQSYAIGDTSKLKSKNSTRSVSKYNRFLASQAWSCRWT